MQIIALFLLCVGLKQAARLHSTMSSNPSDEQYENYASRLQELLGAAPSLVPIIFAIEDGMRRKLNRSNVFQPPFSRATWITHTRPPQAGQDVLSASAKEIVDGADLLTILEGVRGVSHFSSSEVRQHTLVVENLQREAVLVGIFAPFYPYLSREMIDL